MYPPMFISLLCVFLPLARTSPVWPGLLLIIIMNYATPYNNTINTGSPMGDALKTAAVVQSPVS